MLNSSSIARCIALQIGLVLVAPAASAQQQQPALQLNVPYQCPNNTIVVVKHCEKVNGTEVCSLAKGAPNGPLGNEISMPKAQAAALGLVCSLQGGGPQAGLRIAVKGGGCSGLSYVMEWAEQPEKRTASSSGKGSVCFLTARAFFTWPGQSSSMSRP